MKVTIYDIAEKCGVSTATVSKVLNDTGRVSVETRDKVMRAVDEMNFHPSIAASSLTRKQTYTIGLIIPEITNPFFAEVVRAVEDEAFQRGYTVLVSSTVNEADREKTQIERLMRNDLDGYIIASSTSTLDDNLKMLMQRGDAVVLLDRKIGQIEFPHQTILTDHHMGGRFAAEYLAGSGHRDICVFSEPLHLLTAKERLDGFLTGLQAHGLSLPTGRVYMDGFGIQAGHRLAQSVLDQDPRPTAVFAANDLIAIGAMQEFQSHGLVIPQDISIVGYDDIAMASHVYPALTTVAQPILEMGKLAVNMLLGEVSETTPAFHQNYRRFGGHDCVLQPILVVRNSVRTIT